MIKITISVESTNDGSFLLGTENMEITGSPDGFREEFYAISGAIAGARSFLKTNPSKLPKKLSGDFQKNFREEMDSAFIRTVSCLRDLPVNGTLERQYIDAIVSALSVIFIESFDAKTSRATDMMVEMIPEELRAAFRDIISS